MNAWPKTRPPGFVFLNIFIALLAISFTFNAPAANDGGANDNLRPPANTHHGPQDCAANLTAPWAGENALQTLRVALPDGFPLLLPATADETPGKELVLNEELKKLAVSSLQKIFAEVQMHRPDLKTHLDQIDYFFSTAFQQIAMPASKLPLTDTSALKFHPLLGSLAFLGHYLLSEKDYGLAEDFFIRAKESYLASLFSYIAHEVKQLSPRQPARAVLLNQTVNILLPAKGLASTDPSLAEFFKIFARYAEKAQKLKLPATPETAEEEALDDSASDPFQEWGEVSLKLIEQQILNLVINKIDIPALLFMATPHHAPVAAIKFIHLALKAFQHHKQILATNPLLQDFWHYVEAQLSPDASTAEIDARRAQLRQSFYRYVFTLTLFNEHNPFAKQLQNFYPLISKFYQAQTGSQLRSLEDQRWQVGRQVRPLFATVEHILAQNPQASDDERDVLGSLIYRAKDYLPSNVLFSQNRDISIIRRLQEELSYYAYPLLNFAAPGSLFKYDLDLAYQDWAAAVRRAARGEQHDPAEEESALENYFSRLNSWHAQRPTTVKKHFPRYFVRFLQTWQTALGEEKAERTKFIQQWAVWRPLNLSYYAGIILNSYGLHGLAVETLPNLQEEVPWKDLLERGLEEFYQAVPWENLDPQEAQALHDYLQNFINTADLPATAPAELAHWARKD